MDWPAFCNSMSGHLNYKLLIMIDRCWSVEMSKKKVVVKGGGSNLYYVSESFGTIYVYKGSAQIGKTKTMDDAIALIRSHSGKEIESIG